MKYKDAKKSMTPWRTPVYSAQVQTFNVAKKLTEPYIGKPRNVSSIWSVLKPPYCLRTMPSYRTPAIQDFRDAVANEMRNMRTGIGS